MQNARVFYSDSIHAPALLLKSFLYDLKTGIEVLPIQHFLVQGWPVPQLQPTLVLCLILTWRALSQEGWTGITLLLLSLVLGFLMNLSEAALWDTVEPLLAELARRIWRGWSKAPTQPGACKAERVTARASILAGDPARAAAATAFTQAELDALGAAGIKPWDPQAQAALKRLGW